MIVPDLNLLLYAHSGGFPHHRQAREWWERLLSGTDEVGIVPPVALGFVRLATGRRLLETPMSITEAVRRVTSWLEQPYVRFLPLTETTLDRTFALLRQAGAAGNLTTDAQIAAQALEQNAVVATNDSDFARFEGVRTLNPLTS